MIAKVMAVWDKTAKVYNAPFLSLNVDTGIRTFRNMLADERSGMTKYPEDYELFLLATFDDELGRYETEDNVPHRVITGEELKKSELKAV